jgi:hypothetical protein
VKKLIPDYVDVLCEIKELCQKFYDQDIVLCGDLNANVTGSDEWSTMLQELSDNTHLALPKPYPEDHTFVPHHGLYSSRVDFFLEHSHNISKISNVATLCFATNTSDHKPVSCEISANVAKLKMEETTSLSKKLLWHKADIPDYYFQINTMLEQFTPPNPRSGWSVELATQKLIQALKKADSHTVPRPKPCPSRSRKRPKEVINAHYKAKTAHAEWKTHGKDKTHSSFKELKEAKRELRQSQRYGEAQRRNKLYDEIQTASSRDTKLFYKLINMQRKSVSNITTKLEYKGHTYQDTEITEGWATYFEDLATPGDNIDIDTAHDDLVNSDMVVLNYLTTLVPGQVEPFNEREVAVAVRKLKSNKSADIMGITAEHLKNAGFAIIPILTVLFNAIVSSSAIPCAFKQGLILPLFKKLKKSLKMPTNYRGITILSIIGKVLEFVMLLRVSHIFMGKQNSLQRGSTKKVAPIFAALILMEVVREFKDLDEDLVVIMLDAEKAFDKVWHQGLFRKLALLDIPTPIWKLMKDWYTGFRSHVRWLHHISRPINIRQGTLQGSGAGPDMFKEDIDSTLHDVTARYLAVTS